MSVLSFCVIVVSTLSCVFYFLKLWKFSKNNFPFGSALQTLLKTFVVCWLVRFLIVLANCVGYFTFSFINSVNVTAKGIPAAVT
jgi:hypothetical protein